MLNVNAMVSLAFSSILFASGCAFPAAPGAGEEVVDHEAQVSHSPTDAQRIISNGLPSALLVEHRASLISLGKAPLTQGALTQSPLIESDEGRQLLGYIMKCALRWEDKMHAKWDGVTYEIEGGVGLAANWKTGPLSPSEKRWVSACLLAHANALGEKVPLSLRGDHPNLAKNPGEEAEFPVEEAAFYGDLFDGSQSSPAMFACPGAGANDPCEAESNAWLDVRVCASGGSGTVSACGFYVPGNCYDFAAASPGACEDVDADGYGNCHGAAGSPVYEEVITVFLRRDSDSTCGG